jgi:hypothetical protein
MRGHNSDFCVQSMDPWIDGVERKKKWKIGIPSH